MKDERSFDLEITLYPCLYAHLTELDFGWTCSLLKEQEEQLPLSSMQAQDLLETALEWYHDRKDG